MQRIRHILVNDWNPVGFPVPQDEYDTYVPTIFRMLDAGVDHFKLTRHLETLSSISMGIPADPGQCSRAADLLLRMFDRESSGQSGDAATE